MKRNIFKTTVAVACVLCLTACDSLLDAENKANLNAEPYFSDEDGVAALRVNVYNCMKPLVTDVDLSEWGTDLYHVTRGSDPGDFHKYKFTPENSTIESFYKSAYSLINNANCLLKYSGENAQYKAEAIFFRSYGYYLLTQHFGAVPYVTEFIETAEKNYPRKPLSELYPALIADLESIMDDKALPVTDSDHDGSVSREAVKTLLAKICLAAGWDLETSLTNAEQGTYSINGVNYFNKAAQYASEVIGNRQLTMAFEDKWSPTNEGNEEEIFAVQYERDGYPGDETTGGHGLQNTYGSNYGDPTVTGLKSCSGQLVPSEKALYLWQKGDERYEGTFMTTIYNYFGTWGTTGYYAYYNATDADKASMGIADRYFPWWFTKNDAVQYIKEHKSQFVQGTGPNKCHVHILAANSVIYDFDADGNISKTTEQPYAQYVKVNNAATTCVKKFDDPTTTQLSSSTNGYRNIVAFHLSDVFLTAAEAYLMAGNEQQALTLINAVRTRAKAEPLASFADYVPNYSTSVNYAKPTPLDVLLDEKARECFAERTRWIDLRRTRQLVRYNVEFNSYVDSSADMSNVRGEIKWYRPIPATEIATNTGMADDDQNQGY